MSRGSIPPEGSIVCRCSPRAGGGTLKTSTVWVRVPPPAPSMTYNKVTIICAHCKGSAKVWPNSDPKYCSYQCSADAKYEQWISSWLAEEVDGTYPNHKNGPHKRVVKWFKDTVLCCETCGMGREWNGKQLVFEIDHIDGNRQHNHRRNLRYLCPNCHSQTPTYRSKNTQRSRSLAAKARRS